MHPVTWPLIYLSVSYLHAVFLYFSPPTNLSAHVRVCPSNHPSVFQWEPHLEAPTLWFQMDYTELQVPAYFCINIYICLKLVECYIWTMALYGAETWTLRAVDQKYLESFEMWCWRRMEKTSWTDHERNKEVLFRVKRQRNILHEIS
jgi:hypothetical protein